MSGYTFEIEDGPSFDILMEALPKPGEEEGFPHLEFTFKFFDKGELLGSVQAKCRVEAVVPYRKNVFGREWFVYLRVKGSLLGKKELRYLVAKYDPETKSGLAIFSERSFLKYPIELTQSH